MSDLDDVISYLCNIVGPYDDKVICLKNIRDGGQSVAEKTYVYTSRYGTELSRQEYDDNVYGKDIIDWFKDAHVGFLGQDWRIEEIDGDLCLQGYDSCEGYWSTLTDNVQLTRTEEKTHLVIVDHIGAWDYVVYH